MVATYSSLLRMTAIAMPRAPGRQAAALAAAAQLAVGAPDGLLEADGDARRLVVVVLAPDGVRDERGGVPGAAADPRAS